MRFRITRNAWRRKPAFDLRISVWFATSLWTAVGVLAAENLLQNPGFEAGLDGDMPAGWTASADAQKPGTPTRNDFHSGLRSLALPAHSAVEQTVKGLPAGPYLMRFWVKSEADQRVTSLVFDPDRPWAAYQCAETGVPRNQWTRVEVFCALVQAGSLTLQVGGRSPEFRAYHGPETEMRSPILLDDFELVRWEPSTPPLLAFWDAEHEVRGAAWGSVPPGKPVALDSPALFRVAPVFRSRHLVGRVRRSDGALELFAIHGATLQPRAVIVPSVSLRASEVSLVQDAQRRGVRISAGAADYTAWVSDRGLVTIETSTVPQFRIQEAEMSYGLLPSFVGSDVLYAPSRMAPGAMAAIPSTQWFVGLERGRDSLLVAVWDSATQAVSLGLSGSGAQRVIDSLAIDTTTGGFSVSFVEHSGLWRQEPLKEDYLGDYVASEWQPPFPARWMAEMFVSPGGKPSFHEPYNDYSFPVAAAKTRMWGVWFEDWNHYPFYTDGGRVMLHFEKSFVPQGDALFYFLEPAAADLYSPCEIVEQALGVDKAAALFDWDANGLRRLKYTTPPLFMYDRPVCATTTRLSKIKQSDKATVGLNLATHLYEFIREIRGRVDQYAAFFAEEKAYLSAQEATHPEIKPYVANLQRLVALAQSKEAKVYQSPLPEVKARIDAMKQLLAHGQGDGFDCGNLDVRDVAGEQDDLCRRYNRWVLHLQQTAAQNCGDSALKAAVARHLWETSRAVLRQPTRWEPRRTLYFFEP